MAARLSMGMATSLLVLGCVGCRILFSAGYHFLLGDDVPDPVQDRAAQFIESACGRVEH
jgi:hypothetical protein